MSDQKIPELNDIANLPDMERIEAIYLMIMDPRTSEKTPEVIERFPVEMEAFGQAIAHGDYNQSNPEHVRNLIKTTFFYYRLAVDKTQTDA